MNDKLKKLYSNKYFDKRKSNDDRRIKSFEHEGDLIRKYVSSGKLLDIGCSTGEFIESLCWDGEAYGVEISDYAINEAIKKGIIVSETLPTGHDGTFDLIIFRGTIQHLNQPFETISACYNLLRDGGIVAFLATPNTNSLYYKIWNNLPALDPLRNFYVPSDLALQQIMKNENFQLREIEYPYWQSPYACPLRDFSKFVFKLIGFKVKFAFPGNMMNAIFQKEKIR